METRLLALHLRVYVTGVKTIESVDGHGNLHRSE
jgi:hypothetical protein